jgi:predicted dehydrogenase
MTIRIAFAGTGGINKVHARAARQGGAELVAVANHRPDSMAAFAAEFGIARQYDSVEAMLADGGVDALVVATPNYLHAPQTIAALHACVHVMVEKPMAMNAAEAEQMVAASEKIDALLMVAHCWRFDPDVLWLKEHSNKIGRIIRTKGYGVHTHWGPGGWFTQKQFAGGGALADMGIHAIDTTRFLLDDPQPVSVYARISTHYKHYDVDDTGIVIINWDNGATSYIESGWWQPHADGPAAATQLYGEKGFGQLFPTRLTAPNHHHGVETFETGTPHPRPEHNPQSLYDTQMQYFLRCIENLDHPIPGGHEGLVNMKIVDAAYKSSKLDKVIAIE